MIEFTQLLDAYLECRHHKRNSMAALAFEIDLENNLINLYHDIVNGNYRISPSIAFVIEKPVRREVFAADFVIIHTDKEFLKTLVPVVEKLLADDLRLTLHPRKRYLQHYSKGVSFLGVWIKYGALHTGKRTKAGAYSTIHKWSKLSNLRLLTPDEMLQFRDSVNSYWGIMQHHHSYHLRKKMTDRFSAQLCNRISCTNYSKIKMQDYTLIGGGRMIPYVEWWRLFDKKEIEKRRNNKRDK